MYFFNFGVIMNKFLNFLRIAFLPILFVSLIAACEGPEGPAGPAGAAGAKGDKGDPGASASAQCGVCHNNTTDLFAKQVEWEESLHAEGDVFIYGDRLDCAVCHTSEGFREVKETGAAAVKAVFPHPTTINCRTCHNIHIKYDATDWGLSKTTPVKFFDSGESVDLGKANLCGQCHQARAISPAIDLTKPADSLYNVASSRFGPHHSPASNFLANKVKYLPTGGSSYPTTNVHGKVVCMDCHMNPPNPALHEVIQGHSFKMKTVDGATQAVTGCIKCHADEVKTKFNEKEGYYDQFTKDLAALRAKLIEKKWYDSTTNLLIATSGKPIKVSHNVAAAIYAFQYLTEDKSHGIHNPKLARAMLNNATEILSK